MYWIYILKSQSTGKIYIGQTNNLENRLKKHNGLLPVKITSYTKINKGPWEVIYKETFETRQKALKREKYLKSHAGRDWLKKTLGR